MRMKPHFGPPNPSLVMVNNVNLNKSWSSLCLQIAQNLIVNFSRKSPDRNKISFTINIPILSLDHVLTTGFTQCDKTCGGGIRLRMIKVNNRQVLQRRSCNVHSCPGMRVKKLFSLRLSRKRYIYLHLKVLAKSPVNIMN